MPSYLVYEINQAQAQAQAHPRSHALSLETKLT